MASAACKNPLESFWHTGMTKKPPWCSRGLSRASRRLKSPWPVNDSSWPSTSRMVSLACSADRCRQLAQNSQQRLAHTAVNPNSQKGTISAGRWGSSCHFPRRAFIVPDLPLQPSSPLTALGELRHICVWGVFLPCPRRDVHSRAHWIAFSLRRFYVNAGHAERRPRGQLSN